MSGKISGLSGAGRFRVWPQGGTGVYNPAPLHMHGKHTATYKMGMANVLYDEWGEGIHN